jgi:hypothetical protein
MSHFLASYWTIFLPNSLSGQITDMHVPWQFPQVVVALFFPCCHVRTCPCGFGAGSEVLAYSICIYFCHVWRGGKDTFFAAMLALFN